jgi:hypothetical protein
MIYNEEKSLNILVIDDIIKKIFKYNIIILVDESICEYSDKIKYLENILSLFEYYDLFFLNKYLYYSINPNNISSIYDLFFNEDCNSYNYYKKIIEIYDNYNIYDNQYILIILTNNISIDDFGISNMNKYYEILSKIKNKYTIYIILFNHDIENIYNFIIKSNITIINYTILIKKYPNNLIELFKNIPSCIKKRNNFEFLISYYKRLKKYHKIIS